MNIQTAAKYMMQGYRVRRPSWPAEVYYYQGVLGLVRHSMSEYGVFENGVHTLHRGHTNDENPFVEMEDLTADDYVVITENIQKHFNKFNEVQYNDGFDWDAMPDVESDYFD